MLIKNNDATLNRPEGDRILNAPYVYVNIPDYLRIVKEEKAWENSDRNSITVFKGDGLSIVLTALKQEATLEKVQTNGFMSLQLLIGSITVHTPDGEMKIAGNDMMVFNPTIQYTIEANEESCFLLSHYNNFYESGSVL